jgi:arylsulfatase A-like enzyme
VRPARVIALAVLGLTVSLAIAHGIHRADPSYAAAAARPNIVVVETDDQTAKSVRVMQNVISRIGSRGATFQNSFVNYALCCPSRSTFLTGQYAHNHRVLGNVPPNGSFSRFHALHGDNNLAVWLRDAGYYTAMVGKFLNLYRSDPPVPRGWSEWYAAAPAEPPTEVDSLSAYDYTLDENGASVHYGRDPSDYKQDVLTRKAVSFVNRRAPRPQPFFLWLTYTAPHPGGPSPNVNPPFDCDGAPKPAPRHAHAFDSARLPKPPNFNEADVSDKPASIRNLPRLTASQVSDTQRRYRCSLESLLSVDEGVKRVVDALQTAGELNDTLLIFTSDNGYFFGEHRIPSQKQRLYEESIRVPLMMRGPGIPPGVTVSDPVINADLAPTIVGVANASPGLVMDGRSLIPLARQPGIASGRDLLIENPAFKGVPGFKAVRTDRYIYAEHDSGAKELYDLQKDPFELQSRHASPAYSAIRTQLAKRLLQLQDCAGAGCRAQR